MTLRWIHEKPSPHEIWTITCRLLRLLSSFAMSISKAFVFLWFICKFVHRFSSYFTSLKTKHNQTVHWALVWWGQSQGQPELKSSFGCRFTDFLVWGGKDSKVWLCVPTWSSAFSVALGKQGIFCPNDIILSLVVIFISFHLPNRVNGLVFCKTFSMCQRVYAEITNRLFRKIVSFCMWHRKPFFEFSPLLWRPLL